VSNARVWSCSGESNSSAAGRLFDGPSVPHDEHVVAHPVDDREVVADEQVCQVWLTLQIREQVQNPRLDRAQSLSPRGV
jgi:hypothetical protein